MTTHSASNDAAVLANNLVSLLSRFLRAVEYRLIVAKRGKQGKIA